MRMGVWDRFGGVGTNRKTQDLEVYVESVAEPKWANISYFDKIQT